MAALDWFATDVAQPQPVRRPRARPESVPRPRRRPQGLRITGGIFWISAFALLLAGIVAVNVAVLRVNMRDERAEQERAQLQAQNATLAVASSRAPARRCASSRPRAKRGLVPAPAADTSYLDLGRP